MKKSSAALFFSIACIVPGISGAADEKALAHDYMPSLITETPLEGRKLAITIVRKTIGTIQTDAEAKMRVRAIYAEDPTMLMQAAELVNMEFRIIAEANNYWRK